MLARIYALDVLRDEIRSQGIRYDQLLVNGNRPALRLTGRRPSRA